MEVHGDAWKVMRSGSRWVGGVGRQAASGPAQAQSGRWWEGARGRQF